MGSFFFHFSLNLLLLFSVFLVTSSLASNESDGTLLTLKVVDIERPILDLSPSLLLGNSNTQGATNILRCERIQVSGVSRLKLWGHSNSYLGSYFISYHITLVPSVVIPEKLHNKIKVCFHKNNTLEWCQCKKDKWKDVEKGMWSAVMSPYETRYVDVMIDAELSGSVTVSLKEDLKHPQLRLYGIYFGLLLMLWARDSWPLAKGVFLKWTTRAIATTFVFQSTFDIPLAFGALVFCVAYCKFFSLIEPHLVRLEKLYKSPKRTIWADFPVRGVASSSSGSSPQTYSTFHNIENRKKFTKEEWDAFTSNSTMQALAELAASKEFKDWSIEHPDRISPVLSESPDYSTMQVVANLAATPRFISWVTGHLDRIKLFPSKSSDEDNRK